MSKYRNKPVTIDGEFFASTKEYERHCGLLLLQRGGVIRELRRQPRYDLVVKDQHICTYVGDWFYFEGEQRVCEDAKGFRTPVFEIKFALAKALYPAIEFRVT